MFIIIITMVRDIHTRTDFFFIKTTFPDAKDLKKDISGEKLKISKSASPEVRENQDRKEMLPLM